MSKKASSKAVRKQKARPSRPKVRSSKSKLDSFNRSQEIYKLLEKGIIESEALLNSSADRPDDDAHINDLLEQSGPTASMQSRRPSKPKPSRKGGRR